MGVMEGIGVAAGKFVAVACGIGEGGRVAVKKSGTAVTVLSVEIFTPQPAPKMVMAIRRKTVL